VYLIDFPVPHVVRRNGLEYFLENLCIAFRGSRPQDIEVIGERICNLEILWGVGGILMRERYSSHGTGDLVLVGETELRLD
jgi:hypothetical protein